VFCGDQVVAGRALLGWSRAELAAASGVSIGAINRAESSADDVPRVYARALRKIEQVFAQHRIKLIDGGASGVAA
jgi:transcriptional regulator with XRE-family HTH domain